MKSLEDQRGQERDANRENRRIIAALTSRIPAIEGPPEASGSSETVEQGPESAEPGPLRKVLRRLQGVRGGAGCLVARVWDTVIGGVLMIAGGVFGLVGNYWIEKRRWKREDRIRFQADKLDLYGDFLNDVLGSLSMFGIVMIKCPAT